MFKKVLNQFDTTTLRDASGELTNKGWVYLIVAAHVGIFTFAMAIF